MNVDNNVTYLVNVTVDLAMEATVINGVNTTEHQWYDSGKVQIPLFAIIFLLAVIGNSLVILTLVQNQRMRTITNVFLLNLSVSDLLLGVLCMPFTLIGTLLRDFVFGKVMCKLLPYLQGLIVTLNKYETNLIHRVKKTVFVILGYYAFYLGSLKYWISCYGQLLHIKYLDSGTSNLKYGYPS
ncbi:Cholecystokinin-like receptor at 17D1 [Carabus blaptoides fortunei]